MSAADVIKGWSDKFKVGQGGGMGCVLSAIQPGNPSISSGNVVAFAQLVLTLTSGPERDLEDPEGFLLFSDRTSGNQPFDTHQIENIRVYLRLTGRVEIVHPWGTDNIALNDVGDSILTGYGQSIGNKDVPSLWAVTADGRVH